VNTFLLLAYGLLVAVLSLRPGGAGIDEPWDKLAHFVTYAIFAVLARRAISEPRGFAAACVGIVAYSALLEVVQSYVPGRVMSGLDLLANALGVALGGIAAGRLNGSGARG